MFVWLAPAIASLMSARKPNDWNISMSLWPQNAENLKKNVLLQTLKYPWEKAEESLKDFFSSLSFFSNFSFVRFCFAHQAILSMLIWLNLSAAEENWMKKWFFWLQEINRLMEMSVLNSSELNQVGIEEFERGGHGPAKSTQWVSILVNGNKYPKGVTPSACVVVKLMKSL